MKNDAIDWLHDQELPQPQPNETPAQREQRMKDAQALMVTVTARCKTTGAAVTGRAVRRLGSEYWRERNRLHDELEAKIARGG